MKRKNLKPKVFFDASVILSGLKSPQGGSGRLLWLIKQKRITGIISEIILDEALRHAEKMGFKKVILEQSILTLFNPIIPAPKSESVKIYEKISLDQGDTHVLASFKESKVDFLVTLDKKHLLILRGKIKKITIVSPGELLELLK